LCILTNLWVFSLTIISILQKNFKNGFSPGYGLGGGDSDARGARGKALLGV
jgi:hypothetical protein